MKKLGCLLVALILICGCATAKLDTLQAKNDIALASATATVDSAQKIRDYVYADTAIDIPTIRGMADGNLENANKTKSAVEGVNAEIANQQPPVADIAEKVQKGATAAAGVVNSLPIPYAGVVGMGLLGVAALAGVVANIFGKKKP